MKTITLSNGVQMPVQGYGVLQLRDARPCERWVTEALQAGNRLLDTATSYCNEEAVGNAMIKSGVPRKDIFITTKLWIQDAKYENTIAAQIILRWNVQRGVVVISGIQQIEHIRENLDIWDFTLSEEEMREIRELDMGYSEIIDHHAGYTAKWLNEWTLDLTMEGCTI